MPACARARLGEGADFSVPGGTEKGEESGEPDGVFVVVSEDQGAIRWGAIGWWTCYKGLEFECRRSGTVTGR